jgi:hypothetical protein
VEDLFADQPMAQFWVFRVDAHGKRRMQRRPNLVSLGEVRGGLMCGSH